MRIAELFESAKQVNLSSFPKIGWWLGRDIATVVWWAYVLFYAWQYWKSRETVSLSFWLWFVAGLVAGLFWEFALGISWLVAMLIVVGHHVLPL
jgi:hypothetical protein